MRLVRNAALAFFLAGSAVAAQASTYLATLTGTVSSQVNPGSDPNISVGDSVVMTARFNDDNIFDNGVNRYATVYGLPPSGEHFWNVKLNNLTWTSLDDEFDGAPFDFDSQGHPLSLPYFELLPGGKIGTPQGFLTRPSTDKLPRFYLQSGEIRSGDFLFGNTTPSPGFNVTWDLSGAKYTAVPEASVWATMVVGFGLVGAASRRRVRTLRRITC